MIRNVCVVGAGRMGVGIAFLIAKSGCKVIILSRRNKKSVLNSFKKTLNAYFLAGKITCEDKKHILKNIAVVNLLTKSYKLDLVVESIEENITAKKRLFAELEKETSKKTILATNTSSLSVSEIAADVLFPQRVVGIHFFNPVLGMRLVEIIKTKYTSKKTCFEIKKFIKVLGKESLLVKDSPGFIVNRLIMVMINEAINLLNSKISTIKDIDNAMELGVNYPMGPFKLADYIGLDVCLEILKNLYTQTKDIRYKPNVLLMSMVKKNKLGRKSKEGFYDY